MVNSTKCSKVEQVNAVLSRLNIKSSWQVRTEKEALNFVVDVLETESVLGDDKWHDALIEFSNYVLGYTDYMDELASLQYREYGDCE